jgi:hypothetical protein
MLIFITYYNTMTIFVEEPNIKWSLWAFHEKIELNQNRICITPVIYVTKEDKAIKDKDNMDNINKSREEMVEKWLEFMVYDKVQYSYWPPHWYIVWYIRESMKPKDVYKLVNPDNEICQFDIWVGGKTYSFFNNKKDWKIYRHYTIVEVKTFDF